MTIFPLILAIAGVVLRFDDAHDVKDWRELTDCLELEGLHASLAVPVGRLSAQQEAFLREASANGHEIMDHACFHTMFAYICGSDDEFERDKQLPFVAEADAKRRFLGFRFSFDRTDARNKTFRGSVSNGVLIVSREVAATLERPDKIYIPAYDRFFGFYSSPDGHIQLLSFYRYAARPEGLADLPESDMMMCSSQAFSLPKEVLRYQAQRTRESFRRIGLPDPKVWIQPGGWDANIPVGDFKDVYEREFGYRSADCIPGGTKRNGDPKADDPDVARFSFRPTSYLDSPRVTPETIRKWILEAREKNVGLCFISHMNPSPKMKGGWSEWLNETKSLLRWLKENEIPVRTFSEMTDYLWKCRR